MTKNKDDITGWFDAQLDDLKGEFDRLGGASERPQGRERPAADSRPSTTTRPPAVAPTPVSKAPVIAPTPKIAPPVVGRSQPATKPPASRPARPSYTPPPVARDTDAAAARQAPTAAATTPAARPEQREEPRRRAPAGGSYMLGVDVGGTFTDLLLIEEKSGHTFTAKVPSTPQDSSLGVLNGIERICASAGIEPAAISQVMHGTTVATNTILTGTGARVGLVTTKGYKQTLQIARSYVPGGLGGWVIFNKSDPLAPLELTIEADERIGARGEIVDPLDEARLREDLTRLAGEGIEALTVSLMNSYTNGVHEEKIRAIAEQVMHGVAISISSEIVPEMYEYERTETTVVNS